MLVLSRREKETVRFPNLGIAVEVVRIKGKTVRLGIDAPKEIRAVRGELDLYDVPASSRTRFDADDSIEIQQNLDAANLAIHLAQNQLRQGLSEHADQVLEQAIECMQKLEAYVCGNHDHVNSTIGVREKKTSYQLDRERVVMIVSANPVCQDATNLFRDLGYRVIAFDDLVKAIKFLAENLQPQVLLVQSGNDEFDSATRPENQQPLAVQELKIPGIVGLRQGRDIFFIGNHEMLGWFASEDDEKAISEERRLCYVGVTRAQERLTLVAR